MSQLGLIASDLAHKRAVFAADGAEVSKLRIFMSDGTSANILYRTTHWLGGYRALWPLAFAVQWLNKWLNHCVIGIGADFGPGFVLMHPVGVVINSKVRGGRNVVLESGVVIGDEKGRSPELGDDVFVGAGAKVIGPVTLGDGCKVGANAVVVHSVPAGATVVGIPARPLGQRD